eukprot:snap_masked-scaffold_85-processed-gene-0.15-mRNA-1 protein AED:1.00 eAED:1.00 QI:0/0/0/0/1/1/2/0/370
MCLTLLGSNKPENKLCGAHGTCFEGKCICDSGWNKLLDFSPTIASGQGIEQLFKEHNWNQNKTSYKEFESILLKSSPCAANENLRQIISILCLIVTLFCLGFLIFFRRKTNNKHLFLKIIVLFSGLIYSVTKLILGEKASYPYYFPSSFLLALYMVGINTVIYFYFFSLAKYHLKKAKLLFALKVTFYSFEVEKILKYQIFFSFITQILIFSFSYFAPSIYLYINKGEDKFSFYTIKTISRIQITQNILAIFITFYYFLISNIVLEALLKDLNIISSARSHYIEPKETNRGSKATNSSSNNIEALIKNTALAKVSISISALGGFLVFIVVVFVNGGDYLLAYLAQVSYFQYNVLSFFKREHNSSSILKKK